MANREVVFTIIDEAALPGYPISQESDLRLMFSAIVTLTLAILGSSTLPIPFAFSRLGVALGVFTMVLVAACNVVTSSVLLQAAGSLHHDSYEGVAEAAGGPTLKLVTQLSLGLLLFGTLVGDYALLAGVGPRALKRLLAPAQAPDWLVGYEGRGVMVLLTVLLVFPLCLLRRMRSLEAVATSGIAVVVGLMGVLAHGAISAGLPAIRSGDFPIWGVQGTPDLPEAFAIMGFAFYCQPMLLPLLHEMPRGPRGLKLTSRATAIAIFVVANVVFGVLGFFGAARYGLDTQGNVLVNAWIGGRGEGVLDLVMTAYLAVSAVIVQMSLRYTVDALLMGEDAPYHWLRSVLETAAIIGSSLAVALFFPSYAEKIFAVTGVVPVCLVSYVLPVVIHLYIFCRPGGKAQQLGGLEWLRRVFPPPVPTPPNYYEPLCDGGAHTHTSISEPPSLIREPPSNGHNLRNSIPQGPHGGTRPDRAVNGVRYGTRGPDDGETADGAGRGSGSVGASGERVVNAEASGHVEVDDGVSRVPLLHAQSSRKGQCSSCGVPAAPNGHARQRSTTDKQGEPLTAPAGACGSRVRTCASMAYFWEVFREAVVPIAVALIGVGFSIGGVWVALHHLMMSMARHAAELGSWFHAS